MLLATRCLPMTRLSLLLILGMFLACGGGYPEGGADPPTAAKAYDLATVTVGDASFTVELAATPEERSQGLSGRPNLAAGTGMLFVFQQERSHAFWMKDMRCPLDMVWIDAQCLVVDITRNAPPPEPEQALSDLPTFGPSAPVVYVLEINAGESEAGIRPGSRAVFTGSLAGRFGC